jgi:hypothetical protein
MSPLSVYYIEEKIMLFTKLITPIIIKRRRVIFLNIWLWNLLTITIPDEDNLLYTQLDIYVFTTMLSIIILLF